MSGTTLHDRALLRLSGEDVRDFLQGLVTQDALTLEEGVPRWGGLLTPQGKVLFDFLLWADGADVLIDCEADRAEALARRLTMYRLRRKIEIAPEDKLAVHWAATGDRGVDDPRLAALGKRWFASADEPATGWLAHRLALGVTEGLAELGDGTTLWLECNARELNGVSFNKGCFVGQENTARMHYRSKVNRRLIVVPLAEATEDARITYPELSVAVEHRRVESIKSANLPEWIAAES